MKKYYNIIIIGIALIVIALIIGYVYFNVKKMIQPPNEGTKCSLIPGAPPIGVIKNGICVKS